MQSGDEGTLRIEPSNMKGMAGMHLFEITVKSNDPVEPEKKVYLRADFVAMK